MLLRESSVRQQELIEIHHIPSGEISPPETERPVSHQSMVAVGQYGQVMGRGRCVFGHIHSEARRQVLDAPHPVVTHQDEYHPLVLLEEVVHGFFEVFHVDGSASEEIEPGVEVVAASDVHADVGDVLESVDVGLPQHVLGVLLDWVGELEFAPDLVLDVIEERVGAWVEEPEKKISRVIPS